LSFYQKQCFNMSEEKILFSCDGFEKSSFVGFLQSGAFTDVTLVTADDHQIEAHRVILSARSEFFARILALHQHQNTLVYLKGMGQEEVSLVVSFIYQGSCEVGRGQVDRFLEAARELKVKGVIEDNVAKQIEEIGNYEQEKVSSNDATAVEVKDEPGEEGGGAIETQNNVQEQPVLLEPESNKTTENVLENDKDINETNQDTFHEKIDTNSCQNKLKEDEKGIDNETKKVEINGSANSNELKLKQIFSLFKNQSEVETTKYIKLFNYYNKKDTILGIAHAKLNADYDNIVNKLELKPDLAEKKILKNFTKPSAKEISEMRDIHSATCKIFYTKNFSRQFNDQIIELLNANEVVKKDKDCDKDSKEEIEQKENDTAESVPQDTTNAVSVKKEVISYTPEISLVCNQCNITFEKRKFLKHHIQSVHNGIRYQCGKCDYKCKRSCSLKRHKQSVHEGLTRFNCDKCDFQCYEKKNLIRHHRRKHEGIKDIFGCDECDLYFNTLGLFKTHKQSVHGLSYNCDQCDHITKRSSDLKEHKQRVHEGVMYMCDLCDYEATKKSRLNGHVESKHLNIKYMCDLCGAQFGQRTSLKFHEKTQH